MGEKNIKADFHVLIIGAGSVGLLIAQRLKLLNISCSVYEREDYLNSRSRNWNYGIYWAQAPLAECLPVELQNSMSKAQVDPNRAPNEKDAIHILHAETGELLAKPPTPNVFRLNRNRFRELVVEGINVNFGKRLSGTETSDYGQTVIACFEDGTKAIGSLLIGADGANSRVRNLLLGSEKGALHSLPLMGAMALGSLPGDVSRKLRTDIEADLVVSYHPIGLVAFISLHDVPDPGDPGTWAWMLSFTWRRDPDEGDITDPTEIRRIWDEYSQKLGELLRDAFVAAPERCSLWCDRVGQWPTIAWDNRNGKVTLAGDAAHPMTYHRGQGLNNAIHDAAYLGRALNDVVHHGKPLHEAIDAYEKEVVQRGHDAVISSGENSMMLTDWSQVMESPMLKYGMANRLGK